MKIKTMTLIVVAALPVCAGMMASSCASTSGAMGANSLTVPLARKGSELAGYGAEAAMEKIFGPKEEPEQMTGDQIIAKAKESCETEKLSEADCARLMASAEKMTALAMNVQNLDAIAKESRAKQRAAAFQPGNILRDVGGAAVGHQVMLGRIDTINGGAGMKMP